MGDSIDNVPGVDGIGPKTAAELINKFGSLDALLERASAGEGQAGHRASPRRARRSASRASWSACARTCRCPRRWRSCTAVDPDQQAAGRAVPRAGVLAPGRAAVGRRARRADRAARRATRPHPCRTCPAADARAGRAAAAGRRAIILDARRAGGAGRRPSTPPASSAWRRCGTGRSAVRADLVGMGFALPRRAPRVPAAPPPLPGRARLPARERALADAGARAGVAGDRQATPTTPRRWRCCCSAAGRRAGGRRVRLHAGRVPAGRVAHPLRPGRRRRPPRASPTSPARASWMGTGASAPPGQRHRRSRRSAPRLARRGGRRAGAGRAAAGEGWRRPASTACTATMELPLAHVLARIECRGITLDIDQAARDRTSRSARRWSRWRRRSTRWPGSRSTSTRTSSSPTCCSASCRCRSSARPRPARRPTPTRWRSWRALHPVPAKIVEFRALSKLKGTYIDALPALVNPATGAAAHVVQPGGRRDGAAVVQQPQPAEHPDPDRGGPAHPRGVRRQAGPRAGVGRLLADRAADPGALLGGSGVPRRVPLGPGHPPADGRGGVRRAAGVGHRRAPAHRQGDQLRAGRSGRPTSAWRRCCASRARRRAATSTATSRVTPASAATWSARSPMRAPARRGDRRCSGGAGRCPRSAPRARRTATTPSASRATRPSRGRRPTC